MTAEYGGYAPITPRSMSQNRNSAIASPRTRQPAGTNTGLANPMQSSVSKQMNIPTPTAPGGHRQIPMGGKTATQGMFNPNQGSSPVNSNERINNPASPTPHPQSQSLAPQNPIQEGAFQEAMAQRNKLINRGETGMAIPRGNPQSPPPQGIYNRPPEGRRY